MGIAVGPDGALWFTNAEGNSIGRITTGGKVSVFRHASISLPEGIVAGPDGALWFTNASKGSIGRITTGGKVSAPGTPASPAREGSRRGRTAPSGSPTTTR